MAHGDKRKSKTNLVIIYLNILKATSHREIVSLVAMEQNERKNNDRWEFDGFR